MAYPIVFTNRAAFDAAVGNYTRLTFDKGSGQISPTGQGIAITYGNLVKFEYDLPPTKDPNTDGTIIMGVPDGFQTTGRVLSLVTAFGFDILSFSPESGTMMISCVFGPTPPSGYDVRFSLTGLNFLGFVSDAPFTPTIIDGPDKNAIPCRIKIDNMAIKAVPSPPTGLRVN